MNLNEQVSLYLTMQKYLKFDYCFKNLIFFSSKKQIKILLKSTEDLNIK